MTQRHSDPTFKRRKFTITESLDAALEELADQNYQGNVSLCIRAAIEDHRETLDGTGSGLLTKQLARRVDELTSRQDRVLESLSKIEENIERPQSQASHSTDTSEQLPENAALILETLETVGNGLRIDDLTDRLEVPSSRVQPVIGTLIDYGLVTAHGKPPSRYYLAGEHGDRRL
jgi:hypothetical protein